MTEFNLMDDTKPPVGTRFVAVYNDGGGAELFLACDGGAFLDSEGDEQNDDCADAFLYWFAMPDSFRLWFERD